jgi:Raf kinase inhibitor-like YbhB/YbcL family protein
MRIFIILMGLLFFTIARAGDFTLTSPRLANNERIPLLFTCDGKNVSPPLRWANPPANTVAYALELYSPDSIAGVYYNWIIYNIPGTLMALEEGANKDLPGDTLAANNSTGDEIYRGPCPPDAGLHHYVFELYALDAQVDLSGSDIDDINRILKRHKIKSTTLTILFNH